MDKKDTRPYEVRLKEFQESLVKLCRLYRIELIATIGSTPQAIMAQLRFVDLNNPEMMAKYGLVEAPNPENPPDTKNTNPVRN